MLGWIMKGGMVMVVDLIVMGIIYVVLGCS